MKRYLFMLLIPLVLLSGCGTNYSQSATSTLLTSPTRFQYYHDNTHKVGIWWDTYTNSGMAILPDKDYFNVGEPIGQ